MGAFTNDIAPEAAAATLRELGGSGHEAAGMRRTPA